MSTGLTVNGTEYLYPQAGENPGWGEEAHDWAVAVTAVLNSVLNSTDITVTDFTVANNQVAAANVTGLSFDGTQVRGAFITFTVYRSTDSGELSEAGELEMVYNTDAGTWDFTQEAVGDCGMTFSVLASGQVQYTSTDLAGASYAGLMKFKATTIQI